jgi:DNA-binding LacI/PurR family transcriptional regulator
MATSRLKSKSRKRRLTAAEVVRLQGVCRERLLSDLLKQEASPGTPLAGQRSLSEQYGIPLSVVRSTVISLRDEGVISSVARGGMRLAATPELPKSLAGVKVGFVGSMEVANPDSKTTRPAVICTGLERTLNEQGGTLQFFNVWGIEDFQSLVAGIKRDGIGAILYTESTQASARKELMALAELGLPMVAIETETNLCPRVSFDNAQIGRMQAEHILELGHRDVCTLEFPEHEWSNVRARSIREEFRRRGLKEPETCAFRYPQSAAEVGEFVGQKTSRYTACIAVNDDLACLLLSEAAAQGIRVPNELSVIGVDDLVDRRHFNLTTVQLSAMELGLAAFNILKEQILDPETRIGPAVHLLSCPLIVRGTSDKPQESVRSV